MPIVKTPTYPDKHSLAEIPIGAEARGSIEKVRTYQITTVTIDGDMQNRRRVQQQKAYHVPADPKTETQLTQRQKFTDGMAAWALLTPEQKAAWAALAAAEFRNRGRYPGSYRWHSGVNLFMRDYLNTN